MPLPTNEILDDFLINQRQEVKAALMALAVELERAEQKHPRWPMDVIHCAAVVVEEAGELQRAALQVTYEQGSVEAVMTEARHTGATALRFLISRNTMISVDTQSAAPAYQFLTPRSLSPIYSNTNE